MFFNNSFIIKENRTKTKTPKELTEIIIYLYLILKI